MLLRTGSSLLLLLALGTPLAAQSGLSIVAGVTSTSLSYEFEDGDAAEGIASRTGFALGIAMNRGASAGLSFAPEQLYVMKGANDDDSDFYSKLSYIEVPLLFRYSFASGGTATPFVTAGPAISYLLSCSIGDEDGSDKCDDVYDDGESYKAIDYGLMLGAGVNFNRFGVSLRYELGLGNITEEACCTEKNTALMLLGSISF